MLKKLKELTPEQIKDKKTLEEISI